MKRKNRLEKSENKDDSRLSDTESNNGSGSGENGSKNNKKESSTGDDLMMIGTVIVSLAIAIALFMLLPAFIAGLLEHVTKKQCIDSGSGRCASVGDLSCICSINIIDEGYQTCIYVSWCRA